MIKQIEGHKDFYISDEGTVYKKDMTELHEVTCGNGYRLVHLYTNGVDFSERVHRLVAKAFPEICGEWFEGCEVDHRNGIKWDNRAENLRVCTHQQNVDFYYELHPERKKKTKQIKPIVKKAVFQYTKDGTFIRSFPSAYDASKVTGIHRSSICECCQRKRKTSGGFIWQY